MATPGGIDVSGVTGSLPATATDFVGPFTRPVLALGTNPQRIYIVVYFSLSTGLISPAPGSTTLGMGPDVSGQPGGRLIHRASYPGLCQGEWFVYDAGGGTIRVYEVQTEPPPLL